MHMISHGLLISLQIFQANLILLNGKMLNLISKYTGMLPAMMEDYSWSIVLHIQEQTALIATFPVSILLQMACTAVFSK